MSPNLLIEDTSRRHQSLGVVSATMLIGTASMLVMGVQPILLGGLVDAARISEAGVGQAAMIEIFALAVGATAGPFLMNRGDMRANVAAASLLLVLVNLLIHWASGPAVLLQRGLAGLLEGLLLGAVSAIFTHNDRPERMSGLLLGLSTIPQVIAAYLLPIVVIPRFGVDAGFAILAGAAMLSCLAAPAIVVRVPRQRGGHGDQIAVPKALLAIAAAAFLQNAGIGAAWSYMERLATQHHFEASVVGAAIAGSLAFQVGGALLASWLGWRLPSRLVLILGALLEAGLVVGLVQADHAATFIASAWGFGLFWLALQPFLVTAVITLEPSRTAAMLLAPLALVGFSAGPLAASLAIRPGHLEGGFWIAAALLVVAAALYALAGLMPSTESTSHRQGPRHSGGGKASAQILKSDL